MTNSFFEGFFLQASLILALGAQNLFVLESGLKRRRSLLVATICSLCDAVLIGAGVLGAASLFIRVPMLKSGFGILGVGFLAYYGMKKLIEGVSGAASHATSVETSTSFKKVMMLSLGFSLLNPHVYLDTLILIGGYSAKFLGLDQRALFGAGAASFSAIWFFGLSILARSLSRLLNNPRAMRGVAFVAGVILILLSFRLGADVYGWMFRPIRA